MEKSGMKKEAFLWTGVKIGAESMATLLLLLWVDALLVWKEVLPMTDAGTAIVLTAFLSGMTGTFCGGAGKKGWLPLVIAASTMLFLLLWLLAARKDIPVKLLSVVPITASTTAGMITMKITKIYNMHKNKEKRQRGYHK